MGRLFVLRSHPLLISVGLFWFLVGCSKPPKPAASIELPPVDHAGDEKEQEVAGEQRMGTQPKFGFKEYVKNPDLFRKEAQEIDEANDVLPPNEKELKALVVKIGQKP
jgi:hypothetical protein